MNIILLTEEEFKNGLSLFDYRVQHITHILNLKEKQTFRFAIINKKEIYSCIYKKDSKLFCKEFNVISKTNELHNLKIAIGLMRPIVAKRIFKDLASIGVSEIIFFCAKLSEKSYLDSSLFQTEIYTKYLIDGAMQGGLTLLPKVSFKNSLTQFLEGTKDIETKILLDKNGNTNLVDINGIKEALIIIGPERGFTGDEVKLILNCNFLPCSISRNILRTETATISAAVIATQNLSK